MAAEKKRPKLPDGTDPFVGLTIASHQPLHDLQQRSRCSECGASRKYFCYTCCIPVPDLQGRIPTLKLPLKVDIIKHARELDGKSTAIHAAILAPDDVTIYTYPSIPDYDNPSEKVVLVYPGKNAMSLDDLCAAMVTKEERCIDGKAEDATSVQSSAAHCPFNKVVFIDCTWNQTNQIIKDERLRDLQCVILEGRKTCFWRGQDKPDSYLATIEAIFYFLEDFRRLFGTDAADAGRYDNMLYFYSFMYDLVHQEGGGDETKREKKVENG